jgi:hypothetical protein
VQIAQPPQQRRAGSSSDCPTSESATSSTLLAGVNPLNATGLCFSFVRDATSSYCGTARTSTWIESWTTSAQRCASISSSPGITFRLKK